MTRQRNAVRSINRVPAFVHSTVNPNAPTSPAPNATTQAASLLPGPPSLRSFDAIVFDFDGVLTDSEPMHAWAIRETVRPHGWDFDHNLFVNHIVGNGDEHAFRTIARVNGRAEPLTDEEVAVMLVHKQGLMLRGIEERRYTVHHGSIDVVRRTSRLRPVGLCTGTVRGTIVPMLRAIGLAIDVPEPVLRAVVCADDVRRNKPDPEGYLRASALLGVDGPGERRRRCAAIEDSPTGVRAAKAAGLFVIAVGHTFPAEPLAAAGADAFIERLSAIVVD